MIRRILDLIFPRKAVCMGCGSMVGCERNDICDDCREKLAKCWIGVRTPQADSNLDGAAFAYAYRGVAENIIRKMKYASVRVLAEEMGADIARAARLLQADALDLVVPVPMHPKRLRERGYNQSELLAVCTAQRLNLPCEDVLMRTRNVIQQARLDGDARRKNLDGVFAVRSNKYAGLKGARVLLVDDVYTTGTTARQCAAALRRAGVERVYFASYAQTKQEKHRRRENG